MGRCKTAIVSLVAVWSAAMMTLSAYILLTGRHVVQNTEDSFSDPPEPSVHLYHYDSVAAESLDKDTVNVLDEVREKLLASNTKGSWGEFERVVAFSSLLPPISNITRIPTPSQEVFLRYIAPVGLPVIFTDMLAGTSLDGWSWDMVRDRWGDREYSNTRQGNYSKKVNKFGKHYVHRVTVTLKDFIDVVTGKRQPSDNEKGLYITKQRVLPPEELENMFVYPPFYPNSKKKCFLEPTGWIGAPGTFTQGHIDSKDNFVYQMIGKKRWTIFPPRDYKNLYYRKEKGSLEWSAVLSQLGQPDDKKYPLFRNTHPVSFIMSPGEVLYLPRGWTHFVENITPSLMLNTWRRGPAAILEPWFSNSRKGIRKACF